MRVVVSVPQYYVHIRKGYVSKRGFDGFFYGLFFAFYISLGFFYQILVIMVRFFMYF